MQRIVTEQSLNTLIADILAEKKDVSLKMHNSFEGIPQAELLKEISSRLGDKWVLQKDSQVKFTKDDINAVANSRFYRKTGIKIILSVVLAFLVLSILSNNITIIPQEIFYGLCGLMAVVFVFVYSQKQAKMRKELWGEIGGGKEQREIK